MRESILFFCQASGDIVYILGEIDRLIKEGHEKMIKVLCLNHNLYECFKHITINNVEIVNFERKHPPISKPWLKRKYKKVVEAQVQTLDENEVTDKKAYFLSIYDDAATPLYLLLLKKRGFKLMYLNHYDDKQHIIKKDHITIYQKAKLLSYWYCTDIKFDYYNMAGRWDVTRFPKENYEIQESHPELNAAVLTQYAYHIPKTNRKLVLFFSQPNREKVLIGDDEYNRIHHEVIKVLKDHGYFVVIKGHPNHGICPSNENQGDMVLPEKLPSELIDMSQFSFSVGFMTIGLGSTAKLGVPTFSFLPMMSDKTSKEFSLAIDFSNSTSDNKIMFASSGDDLIKKMEKV